MNKKFISFVVASAAAISLSVSSFAATTADPSHKEMEVDTLLSIPTISVTWPTSAGVLINPYKMKVKYTGETDAISDLAADDTSAAADDSTIISPAMVFSNNGNSDVAVTVTGSVNATTAFDDNGNPLGTNAAGKPIVKASDKITFAAEPIVQPYYDTNGEYVAGDARNSVLIYLEAGELSEDGKTYKYTGTYDKNNDRQMLLGTEDTTKKLFTIAAGNGSANVKICGDVALDPAIGWDTISRTDTVNIKLIFNASPIAPLPEKPAKTEA